MLRIVQTVGIIFALCLAALSQEQQGDVPLGDLARAVRQSKPVVEDKVKNNNSEIPLGDVARAARKSKPVIEDKVIDNDNFASMMNKAESARLNGQPVFSIDPGGRTFRMTSLDGTCSLSFDAKSGAPSSAVYIATDLPQDELLKLEGPAAVHDDELQVTLHNGTGWELKEIVVGITVLQSQSNPELHPAKLVTTDDVTLGEKLPDMTVLYHLRGTGAPDSTSVFSGGLGGNLPEKKDWHWAIISARGIPPASAAIQTSQPAQPATPASDTTSPANGPAPNTTSMTSTAPHN